MITTKRKREREIQEVLRFPLTLANLNYLGRKEEVIGIKLGGTSWELLVWELGELGEL